MPPPPTTFDHNRTPFGAGGFLSGPPTFLSTGIRGSAGGVVTTQSSSSNADTTASPTTCTPPGPGRDVSGC